MCFEKEILKFHFSFGLTIYIPDVYFPVFLNNNKYEFSTYEATTIVLLSPKKEGISKSFVLITQ
jgi:hypothetical protein